MMTACQLDYSLKLPFSNNSNSDKKPFMSTTANSRSQSLSVPKTSAFTTPHSFYMPSSTSITSTSLCAGSNTVSSQLLSSDIPFLYCSNKKILIDLAKCFALHHGYKLVISKNDKKRCILKCSKHSKRATAAAQAAQATSDIKSDSPSSPPPTSCSCNFRVEVQYKIKKDLWLLKPVVQSHSHSSTIELPAEMALISSSQTELVQGRSIRYQVVEIT
ncbi:unnamed protein product [Ambrosiozyma monospora]|uniref:Unnamed protein product n=1 Tax=Ambrosiozyma monospora TaxID=43982 RepID=A0ACB5TCZ7_AMBMO|nr:unnamed protein product [Ambrosiozyma monospora]